MPKIQISDLFWVLFWIKVELVDAAKLFWSMNLKNSADLPRDIQDKEIELNQKEKALIEKEQMIKRLEGEVSLLEQSLKKKQREESEKREELIKKETSLKDLEQQVKQQVETSGGKVIL